MSKRIRDLAKRTLPKPLLIKGWTALCLYRARKARAIFERAGTEPKYLGWQALHKLQQSYPPVELDYHYDPESLRRRGRQRVENMLNLVRKEEGDLHLFLDLGTWDGMTCAALEAQGKSTVGIDIRPEGFTEEAAQRGVQFFQMDATCLGFEEDSFDFVFSFNSFEHFPDPEAVLREAIRVVRPGGYIYLDFGPLYWSAKGAHQFKTIHVPYNQCLFSKELLRRYGEAEELELTEFFWMNEWSIDQFRDLWQKYAEQLERVVYYETYNADHMELITRYPSCFRSKSDNFDDFLVAYIEVLFRKRS